MSEPGFTGLKDSISDSKFQIQRLNGKWILKVIT
jgi:hypothetical protein